MANDLTTTGQILSDQAAYDRLAYFALRPELYFDAAADVKPTRQTSPGATVKFTQYADLAVASTAINESVDIDSVQVSDAHVTLTLAEYGNVVTTTAKARGTSFLDIDADVANIIGFNAGVSFDTLARDVLKAGTNVIYSTVGATDPPTSGRNQIEPEDKISAHDVRRVYALLAGANVATFNGYYKAWIHPDVALDLREETGAAAWRDPHTYSQPAEIWNGSIGSFEGFDFIQTPRAPVFADAGSSTTLTDVYATIFAGRQALAKTWSTSESAPMPQVRRGPVVDRLNRFHPIGWYWLGAHGIFRQAALYRLETSSSVGVNA